MQEKDFWRLTLRQFCALAGRHTVRMEREDYRAALICATLANGNRDPKKKPSPFTPQDFMLVKAGMKLRQSQDDIPQREE